MPEQRFQSPFIHILVRNTSDQDRAGLRELRVVRRDEVTLPGDEPMLHLVPYQVDDPDCFRELRSGRVREGVGLQMKT